MGSAKNAVISFALGFILALIAVSLYEPIGPSLYGGTEASTAYIIATETVTKVVTKTVEPRTVTQVEVLKVTERVPYEVTRTVTRTVTETVTVTRWVTVTRTRSIFLEVPTLETSVDLGVLTPPRLELGQLQASAGPVFVLSDRNGGVIIVNVKPPRSFLLATYIEVEDEDGNRVLSFGFGADGTPPRLAYYDGSMALVHLPLDLLLEKLSPGSYRLTIPVDNTTCVECRLTLSASGARVSECAERSVILEGVAGRSVGDALVWGVNKDVLRVLRENVWGSSLPTDSARATWSLLRWVEENFRYDTLKALNPFTSVYTPLEMLRVRRGVCSDYAVFTTAGLLAAHLPGLVIVFPDARHAVAATVLSGNVYVLDQRLPVISLQDYLEYVLPGRHNAVIYLVARVGEARSAILVYTAVLDPSRVPDDYESDRLPPSMEQTVSGKLGERLHSEANPGLKSVMEWLGVGTFLCIGAPVLNGVPNRPAPLDALYSPVFNEDWVEYLASLAARLVAVNGGSLWVHIYRDNAKTCIQVYRVPIHAKIDVVEDEGKLVVYAESPSITGITSIQLLLYARRAKSPCAGVAPPRYQYPTIPFINAEVWRVSAGHAAIEVDAAALRRLASSSCGLPAGLVVWIGEHPVYVKIVR